MSNIYCKKHYLQSFTKQALDKDSLQGRNRVMTAYSNGHAFVFNSSIGSEEDSK